MRVLLLGGNGQVGLELAAVLPAFATVASPDRAALDISDLDALRRTIAIVEPNVIVNAASYNDVDGAEKNEALAIRINGTVVRVLGEEAAKHRALLIHYSTDFVFDGKADTPYWETDKPSPLSAYGRSKLAGERALIESEAPTLIFRTSWVYGLRRKSFVRSILQASREQEMIRVVRDQVGCPTAAKDLAIATALILFKASKDPYEILGSIRGIYHLCGDGYVSRLELARAVLELTGSNCKLESIDSKELNLPATRPVFAPLNCDKAKRVFGVALPPWRESLARCLQHPL